MVQVARHFRLIGGPDNDADFEAACRWAEGAVRFHLECEAEERGESQVEEAQVVHLVASPGEAMRPDAA